MSFALPRSMSWLAMLVLGAMLVVRMGPLCDAIAQSAPPAMSADCASMPMQHQPPPRKNHLPAACAQGCLAIAASTDGEPFIPQRIGEQPFHASVATLVEWRDGPSPPPPRTA